MQCADASVGISNWVLKVQSLIAVEEDSVQQIQSKTSEFFNVNIMEKQW